MFPFKSISPRWLGIDISSTSIKVIELSRKNHTYQVESYAVLPFSQDTVIKKIIQQPESVKNTIKKALSLAKTQSQRAVIALPDSLVITKVLQVPNDIMDSELENYLWLQASQLIPYDLSEVNIDFNKIHPSKGFNQKTDVLLIAARMADINDRTQLFTQLGLEIPVVDLESFAVARVCHLIKNSLPNFGQNKTIAVMDIGSTTTQLTILTNLSVVFTQETLFGGKQLTQLIQRFYGLDHASAGLAKKTRSLPDNYLTEVLAPFQDLIVLHTHHALQDFLSNHPHEPIDRLLLAGGTANIPELSELIQNKLEIKTFVINPFETMSIGPQVDLDAFEQDKPALLIACGLALRGFV